MILKLFLMGFDFIFFLMSKANEYSSKKKSKVYYKYTQGPSQNKGKRTKMTYHPPTIPNDPHLHPSKSKKSIKKLGLSTMYKYVQDQKSYRNDNHNFFVINGNHVPLPPNGQNHEWGYHPSHFYFLFLTKEPHQ